MHLEECAILLGGGLLALFVEHRLKSRFNDFVKQYDSASQLLHRLRLVLLREASLLHKLC